MPPQKIASVVWSPRYGTHGQLVYNPSTHCLRSVTLPLTVSTSIDRPPPPIVPVRLRGLTRPVTLIGKSVEMLPLTVVARTSVLTSAGRSSVMLPLTVLNLRASVQSLLPRVPRIDPFTVDASPYAVVEKLASPFTVFSETGPTSESAPISPLTVRPTNRTPRRHANRERDSDIIVARVHSAAVAGLALVWP